MRSSSAVDSGSNGPGSSPGRDHCVFTGQDSSLSPGLSPLRCINGHRLIVKTSSNRRLKSAFEFS